jgi:hypothetical protein
MSGRIILIFPMWTCKGVHGSARIKMFVRCTSLLQIESCTTPTVDSAITRNTTFSCLVCTRLVIHLVCTCGLPLFLPRARSLTVPSLNTRITAIETGANNVSRNLIRPGQIVHEAARSALNC